MSIKINYSNKTNSKPGTNLILFSNERFNTNGLKNFLFGNLNFQKGISNKKTNPILNEAIKMGGTELLRANLATGNALP